MPWQTVDAVIDEQFDYNVPKVGQTYFTAKTGRPWDLAEDSDFKKLKCPACTNVLCILWTTCSLPEDYQGPRPGLTGNGYGEKDLSYFCERCGVEVDHDMLRVAKFKKDTESLLLRDYPMPGTIIFGTDGIPKVIFGSLPSALAGSFPNRLITVELKTKILELCSPGRSKVTMMDVRSLIEDTICSSTTVRKINSKPAVGPYGRLSREERLAIRKMMSKYWDSHTIFGMELGSAVIRQGEFINKMRGLDWLHSPAARNTMARLIKKYGRFIDIMGKHPRNIAVPTLDVDLAWHTHQLSPAAYFAHCMKATVSSKPKFIDHDDKIDEDQLSEAFEWTSKTYETLYGEVYSECSCWYCEAIRAKHVSSIGSILGASKHEKITDAFYNSGGAELCPPDKSAHISSHNAMPVERSELHAKTYDAMTRTRQRQLDQAYEKACKRAIKKGRKPPEKAQFQQDHWGYGYYGYYPYMGAYIWMTPGLYYGPMAMPMGTGMYGNCAAGTCGGAVAAGGCGGPGGCGGGCGSSGGCGRFCYSAACIKLN